MPTMSSAWPDHPSLEVDQPSPGGSCPPKPGPCLLTRAASNLAPPLCICRSFIGKGKWKKCDAVRAQEASETAQCGARLVT